MTYNDVTWTWVDVREWAEDYVGDCSGEVKRLLSRALGGDGVAWQQLADLYRRWRRASDG